MFLRGEHACFSVLSIYSKLDSLLFQIDFTFAKRRNVSGMYVCQKKVLRLYTVRKKCESCFITTNLHDFNFPVPFSSI